MFTGIIQALGTIARIDETEGGRRLRIESEAVAGFGLAPGDSVAVDGACLTALDPDEGGFVADVSRETLRLTTLSELAPGDAVNLEPALRAGDALGGHMVTGHVDGLATLASLEPSGDNRVLAFDVPEELARYVARKGSVTLSGVSLTVNRVEGSRFWLNLIPHTLAVTTLGRLEPGDAVNLEVDLVARYLERLLADTEH